MNRNQLKYFVAAAESRSFTKAAEQFYISQTAITQQIRTQNNTDGIAKTLDLMENDFEGICFVNLVDFDMK